MIIVDILITCTPKLWYFMVKFISTESKINMINITKAKTTKTTVYLSNLFMYLLTVRYKVQSIIERFLQLHRSFLLFALGSQMCNRS